MFGHRPLQRLAQIRPSKNMCQIINQRHTLFDSFESLLMIFMNLKIKYNKVGLNES